jgi:hypothetical protein
MQRPLCSGHFRTLNASSRPVRAIRGPDRGPPDANVGFGGTQNSLRRQKITALTHMGVGRFATATARRPVFILRARRASVFAGWHHSQLDHRISRGFQPESVSPNVYETCANVKIG